MCKTEDYNNMIVSERSSVFLNLASVSQLGKKKSQNISLATIISGLEFCLFFLANVLPKLTIVSPMRSVLLSITLNKEVWI